MQVVKTGRQMDPLQDRQTVEKTHKYTREKTDRRTKEEKLLSKLNFSLVYVYILCTC